VATGDLDKNVIRRVMHAHVGAMRACYEKEIIASPTLAGNVELTFTIAKDGTVEKASASGLANVKDCVVRQVERFKFPAPKGGGVVKVRYPLFFKPKGE
jgi:hypothetical protein